MKSLDHYGYRYQDEAVANRTLQSASRYNNDYHKRGVITDQSTVFEFEIKSSPFAKKRYHRSVAKDGVNSPGALIAAATHCAEPGFERTIAP
ncbi:hypothetical protein GQ56_0105745 [Burkholderia paludis]|uniref:hypothetical protein n=1 Tax=Burkholderia paludis TaxID=1506587 RepID=UPI0004DB85EF|nr:hypothetical protein [Burkholderia paludis]KFG98152.1 hypothetical protein GQ56_0105745 [Burkholderia paludis]